MNYDTVRGVILVAVIGCANPERVCLTEACRIREPSNPGMCAGTFSFQSVGIPDENSARDIEGCPAGFADCSHLRALNCAIPIDTVWHCGGCNIQCNGSGFRSLSTCTAGRCMTQCADGFVDCDGDPGTGCEANLRASPQHCGCCGNTCVSGTVCSDGRCALEPPLPIGPLSPRHVNAQPPELRWRLPADVDSVQVEVCSDRHCAHVERSRLVRGTSWRVDAPLPVGAHFWRLAREGSTVHSATWEFFTGERNAGDHNEGEFVRDLNGDGREDTVTLEGSRVRIHWGGESLSDQIVALGDARYYVRSGIGVEGQSAVAGLIGPVMGDLDRDGYGDAVFWSITHSRFPDVRSTHTSYSLQIWTGGPSGLRWRHQETLGGGYSGMETIPSISFIGDADGDGDGDALLIRWTPKHVTRLPWGLVDGPTSALAQGLDGYYQVGQVESQEAHPMMLDLDGDHADDVLISTQLGVWVMHGNRGPSPNNRDELLIPEGLMPRWSFQGRLVRWFDDSRRGGQACVVVQWGYASAPGTEAVDQVYCGRPGGGIDVVGHRLTPDDRP